MFDLVSGKFCRAISSMGHSAGYLHGPHGVDVLQNHIYVCDKMNDRIQVFDFMTGEFRQTFGSRGNEPGQFQLPTDLTVCGALVEPPTGCDFGTHREAKIVVADTGNHRVQVLTMEGQIMFCSDPVFRSPTGLAVHPRSGHVLVCNAGGNTLVVLSRLGQKVHEFGQYFALSDHFRSPIAVSILNSNPIRVRVMDSMRVQWCDVASLA